MNQNTKQRVVGTIVLLALALIFLPIIFDGEGSYQRPVSSRIPDPPVISLLPEPVPQRVVLENDPPPTVVPEESVIDNSAVSKPQVTQVDDVVSEPETATLADSSVSDGPNLDESGLPEGWSVRLASFSAASNADALLNRLLAANYRAYSRPVQTDQGVMTAVYVGPQLEREKTEMLRRQLQQEFQLNGIIVRFEIERL